MKGKKRKTVVGTKEMFSAAGVMIDQLEKRPTVNAKEGIKIYGEKVVHAILSAYDQIDNMMTFEPQDVNKMTREAKRQTLNLLTMVTEKRDGRLNGRAVIDGRKQRRYIRKEDVASPTVELESLVLSLLIDAQENRDVATANLAGVYLLADTKDHVIVKLTGESVEIICDACIKYKKYVSHENGKKVLYLYGCMQSALLWYHTFEMCLEEDGFKLNKYDPCVAHKDINGNTIPCMLLY